MLNDQDRINKISYIVTGKYGPLYDILKTKTNRLLFVMGSVPVSHNIESIH